MNFDEMGLHPTLLRAVAKQGYTVATPIQSKAIPLVLEGHDVLGCAQTGTGKTAAFALPTLHQLMQHRQAERAQTGPEGSDEAGGPASTNQAPTNQARPPKGQGKYGKFRNQRNNRTIACLVLTPTRELAKQVQMSFATYGHSSDMRQTLIYGGVSQNPQVKSLRAGTDIVIATPGRLLDLMNQGHVDLKHVKMLILDEADQMLDMGFIQDLKKIVKDVPAKRQTLMFSATMPAEIRQLASQWLHQPKMVQATPEASTPDKIKQRVAFVEKTLKPATLIHFLRTESGQRHLVFCRTKHGADRVVKYLNREKIHALAIHGDKSQRARELALEQFSSKCPPVLVATDVAARGLHMPGVSHVFNYDLPSTPEVYIHRIGRTARAGAEGESISFCSAEERPYLKRIEKLIRQAVQVHRLPDQEGQDLRLERPQPVQAPPKRPHAQPNSRKRGAAAKSRSDSNQRPYKSGGASAARKKRPGKAERNRFRASASK